MRIVAASAALVFVLLAVPVAAQVAATPAVPFMGMGDSIGEGVQSGDANQRTQPASYLNVIAKQMGVAFPLPLIKSNPLGVVDHVNGRTRIFPNAVARNVAVSGADSTSILYDRAGLPLDSETDLVISPRVGSQMEVVEAARPAMIACWIGNNDALGAAISFSQLDASQLTPVSVFADNYALIVQRLKATGAQVVLANIPDVDQIAFLFTREDLVRFTGSDFGLPEGSFTSLIAMLLLKTGLAGPALLQDPDWVLDATEAQTVRDRIAAFNGIIAAQAASAGYPVVDVNGLFRAVAANPPVILGVRLTTRMLGGMFSLDGVHPSNSAHAIVADAFIAAFNARYGTTIPRLTGAQIASVVSNDPFVDRDGDGRVTGRPLAGLVETLMPALGLSGDDESQPAPVAARVDPALGRRFMREFLARTGQDPDRTWTRAEAVEALRLALGPRRVAY